MDYILHSLAFVAVVILGAFGAQLWDRHEIRCRRRERRRARRPGA